MIHQVLDILTEVCGSEWLVSPLGGVNLLGYEEAPDAYQCLACGWVIYRGTAGIGILYGFGYGFKEFSQVVAGQLLLFEDWHLA